MSPKQFIDKVIKGVSKNGNFDINVGPTAAGKIPEYEQYPLLTAWVNGLLQTEKRFTEQDHGRSRKRVMHILHPKVTMSMRSSSNGRVKNFSLKSVKPAEGSKITMLGVPGDLKWKWSESNGLTIYYPRQKARPTSCSYAWAFKIKVR